MKPAFHSARIQVISGWREVGKTTLCRRLVADARAAGWDVAGVLSHARFAARQKTGIEVEDLRRGERRLLASRQPGEIHGFALGSWTFDDQVLEWGNQVIASAASCNLLVLDELGPLELEQSRGWTAAFQVLDSRQFALALAVIRPECIDAFRLRWPGADCVEVTALEDIEHLAEEIALYLTGRE
jgi:nucleoside-triphosphatase